MPILILIFIYYANIDIGIVRFLLHHCLLWVLVHVQACALDVPPDVRAVKVTVDPSWRPQRAHGQYVKSAIASLGFLACAAVMQLQLFVELLKSAGAGHP